MNKLKKPEHLGEQRRRKIPKLRKPIEAHLFICLSNWSVSPSVVAVVAVMAVLVGGAKKAYPSNRPAIMNCFVGQEDGWG